MKFKSLISFLFLSSVALFVTTAQAEVIVNGTRFIFPSNVRETTVQVGSSGLNPSLVQVWIDTGDSKSTPDDSAAPFVITPPLVRVDPGKNQAFRILALPAAAELSQTQETLFWLNVLDVPPKPTEELDPALARNFIQLAVRSRLKLFYRPATIMGQAGKSIEKLSWVKTANGVVIKNPTAFYVTVIAINQKQDGKDISMMTQENGGIMLEPFSEQAVEFNTHNYDKLFYLAVNDYGANVEVEVKF